MFAFCVSKTFLSSYEIVEDKW